MERQIESLVRWYKSERNSFGAETYLDASTRIKRVLLPYSDWDKHEILAKEINFNIRVLAELQDKIKKSKPSISEKTLPIIILSLKNRAEYVGSQSDFYPTFVTLIAFLYAFLSNYMGLGFKILTGLAILSAVIYLISIRIKTRLELSHCKELINILEAYDKKHSSEKA